MAHAIVKHGITPMDRSDALNWEILGPMLSKKVNELDEVISKVHSIANELSWDAKTRPIAERIFEALRLNANK